MSNQVYFRIFFSSKENDNFLLKNLTYAKYINFNCNSKFLQSELKFILENVSGEKVSFAWKDNKMKLIKLSFRKEIYYKNICQIINKYEYETNENNFVNDKKLLTEIENEIKNHKINDKKYNKAYKNLQIIKENLEHVNVLCTQSSKIYKLILRSSPSASLPYSSSI